MTKMVAAWQRLIITYYVRFWWTVWTESDPDSLIWENICLEAWLRLTHGKVTEDMQMRFTTQYYTICECNPTHYYILNTLCHFENFPMHIHELSLYYHMVVMDLKSSEKTTIVNCEGSCLARENTQIRFDLEHSKLHHNDRNPPWGYITHLPMPHLVSTKHYYMNFPLTQEKAWLTGNNFIRGPSANSQL